MKLTRERTARHEISDAAWTELCSETNPGGGHLKDEKALSMNSKDAMRWRCLLPLLLLCGLGAKHVTPNFEVDAPTDEIAQKVGAAAEHSRRQLAIEWLGEELPNWFQRCQVRVKVGQIGAGGITTFSFGGGHVFGWDMTVQGSLERILDSVIPHEVSHTIFACHFRRPLPRWADEGAATLAEEGSEQRRQQKLAEEVLPTTRRIPLRELLQITEYPKNMQHVLTLYAEGYSLADYLVQKGGKKRFLNFVQDAHESGWDAAFRKHYEETSIEAIEKKWSRWVIAGSPSLRPADEALLASATRESTAAENGASIVRSQSPDSKSITQLVADSAPKKAVSSKSAPTNAMPFQTAANSGHTVAPRAEAVSAPEPRRRERTGNQSTTSTPAASPEELAAIDPLSSLAAVKTSGEQRRSRTAYLSHPELRRTTGSPQTTDSSAATDADSAEEDRSESPHPSPFAPVASTESERSAESRQTPVPSDLAPTSFRQFSQSSGSRERPAGRSLQSGTPVKPVLDRESTLRFKPFSSK